MEKISVTIITKNEAANIGRTLDSVSFADEIIIVDSFSTDETKKIAKRFSNVKFFEREFINYGEQKNHAASLTTHPWVLNIDADEVVDPKLKSEIQKILSSPNQAPVYALRRINYFINKPIYHGGWYPDFNNRLYHKDKAKWSEPHVHEWLSPLNKNETIKKLESPLHHYSFPHFLSQVKTNMKFAEQGARALLQKKGKPSLSAVLFKPLGKFIECYLVKRGFLDGVEGFFIAINAAHSMFMKYAIAYLNK